MRKIIGLSLLLILVLSLTVRAGSEIKINNSGTFILFTKDTGSPFLDKNNRIQVPFRVTLEAFGAEVTWDQQKHIAIAKKDGKIVTVPLGENFIYDGNTKVVIDTKSVMANNKVYLPIRAVLEAFNAEVDWDNNSQTVLISKKQDISEKRGNSIGNYGKFAADDKYLFYSDNVNDIPLNRINLDGSNKVLLSDDTKGSCSCINVINGWIYYLKSYVIFNGYNVNFDSKLYRVDINGSNPTLISKFSESVEGVQIVDDMIYYSRDDGKIFKMTLDGKDIQEVASEGGSDMIVTSGWIYYQNVHKNNDGNNEFSLHKVKMDGTEDQLITNIKIGSWTVDGEWIYYNIDAKKGMYKIKTDGNYNMKVADVYSGDLKISGEWIYFRDGTNAYIYKMKRNGTGKILVSDQVTTYIFDLCGDWVYYDTYEGSKPYRAKTDGTMKQKIPDIK